MSKKNDQARQELDDILKGLMTDKNMKKNDKYIINHNNAMKEIAIKRKTDIEWQSNQSKRIK